jgi:RNA recognition motif-containing protein
MEGQNRIFVGGIPVRVEKITIVDFFSQFGRIRHCKIKKNSKTGRSLGYAYITFEESQATKQLLNKQIEFCGRICEFKPVFKKDELKDKITKDKLKKLLVYELDPATTNKELHDLFASLTSISHAYVVKDPNSHLNLGYGYVVFEDGEKVEEFCKRMLAISFLGKQIKYSNELHVPPKKKPKSSMYSESNNGDSHINRGKSPSSGLYSNYIHKGKSVNLEHEIVSNLEIDNTLRLYAEQRKQRHIEKMAYLPQSTVLPLVYSRDAIPKSQNKYQGKVEDGRQGIGGRGLVNSNLYPSSLVATHSSGLRRLNPDKDQTGFTESTMQSRALNPTSPNQSASKSIKIRQTSTMKDVLRVSLYLLHARDNCRLNRARRQLPL